MALNSGAVLDAVKALLESVTGIQDVRFGWPASPTPQLTAWIMGAGRGDGRDSRATGGLVRRELHLVVWVGYAIGSAPSAVERALMEAIDEVEEKAYAARATALSGSCESVRFDFTLADNPDYLTMGGAERRVWPFGVNAVQSHTAPI